MIRSGLTIGGLCVATEFEHCAPEFAGAHRDFSFVDLESPGLRLRVMPRARLDLLEDTRRWPEVFNSGGLWRICREAHGARELIEITPALRSPAAHVFLSSAR